MADLANLSSSTSVNNFNSTQKNYASKKEYELLNKINSNGLQVSYLFPRTSSSFANKTIAVELIFKNSSNGDFSSLAIANKKLQSGMSMSDFEEINLTKGATCSQVIHIDFNDTTQSCQFELNAVYSNDPTLGGTSVSKKWPNLSITCPVGELIQPAWSTTENEFSKLQAKLKGMNEINNAIEGLSHPLFLSKNLNDKILEGFHMCQIPSSQQDIIKYAALTSSTKTALLLSLFFNSASNKCHLNVNCENIVLASMFIKEIKQVLQF